MKKANADGQIRVLYEKCSSVYENIMENAFHDPQVYFAEQELNRNHEHANNTSLSKVCCAAIFFLFLFLFHIYSKNIIQFRNGRKLGSQSLIAEWEEKLKTDNRKKFAHYKNINEYREKLYASIWKKVSEVVAGIFTLNTKTKKVAAAAATFGVVACVSAVFVPSVVILPFLYETAAYVAAGTCTMVLALTTKLFA